MTVRGNEYYTSWFYLESQYGIAQGTHKTERKIKTSKRHYSERRKIKSGKTDIETDSEYESKSEKKQKEKVNEISQ